MREQIKESRSRSKTSGTVSKRDEYSLELITQQHSMDGSKLDQSNDSALYSDFKLQINKPRLVIVDDQYPHLIKTTRT